jgi:GR25 family glycosyltransferase involved in LPS biosynthesis
MWEDTHVEYPVYLINLLDRSDRLKTSTAIAEKHGIDFVRVNAVTKEHVSEEEIRFASAPVVACFRSHQLAYQCLLATNDKYALVLEDDYLPGRGFNLPSLLDLEDMGIDVLQLGFLHTTKIESINIALINLRTITLRIIAFGAKIFPLGSERILQKTLIAELRSLPINVVASDYRPGAHAYIVSRRAAELLLEINDPVFLSADELLKSLSTMRTLRIARAFFSKVAQSNSESSIKSRNRTLPN